MLRSGNSQSRKEVMLRPVAQASACEQVSTMPPSQAEACATLLLLLLTAGALAAAPPAAIDAQTYLNEVGYLASPALKGRATGSPELETAASYIANQFKSFGLKPADGKNYEQPFLVTIHAHLGTNNRMKVEGAKAELASGRDYIPFSFSSSGKLAAGVVFAGYGITANDRHYDD